MLNDAVGVAWCVTLLMREEYLFCALGVIREQYSLGDLLMETCS